MNSPFPKVSVYHSQLAQCGEITLDIQPPRKSDKPRIEATPA